MEFSAKQIAEYLGGNIEGDENVTVNTFAKIEEGVKGALSFLSNPKYSSYIYNTNSSIVLINKDFHLEKPVKATLIRVDNAYGSLAKLLTLYESMKPKKKGVDSLAFVAETAKIGNDVYLAPFSYVGDGAVIEDGAHIHAHAYVGDGARIGQNTILYANSVVYHDCVIGNNCILHSGCVIGADGFGFAPTPNGYEKIPQIGIVIVEDNVEIGANTCIDRATMGRTLISQGVKLDNLIQIAHNDEIGQNTVMAAQVGIAGSTKIGQWCMLGGQVGIAGHIKIADQTQIGAQAGVAGTVKKPGQALWGSPAYNANDCTKSHIITKKLPEMYKQLNELQNKMDMLLSQFNQE